MNKESIDVVIVADSKSQHFNFLTDQTIRTAVDFEKNLSVNVIVVEKQNIQHPRTTTLKQDEPFNYNECLIKGAMVGNAEYIMFANNDLVFREDWATALTSAMKLHNANSASPYSYISNEKNNTGIAPYSGIYEGYEIRKQFCGWAFCWTRQLFNELSLDTRVNFWCSDNATAEQLKQKNEKHILVTSSIVEHYENGSRTLYSMSDDEINRLTSEQVNIFKELYKKDIC